MRFEWTPTQTNKKLKCIHVFLFYIILFCIFLLFFFVSNVVHKRKTYDNRSTNKNSNYNYSHHKYHHHYGNNDYASASAYPRRGNRFAGFTLRGLFEPTPFYRFFGSISFPKRHKSATSRLCNLVDFSSFVFEICSNPPFWVCIWYLGCDFMRYRVSSNCFSTNNTIHIKIINTLRPIRFGRAEKDINLWHHIHYTCCVVVSYSSSNHHQNHEIISIHCASYSSCNVRHDWGSTILTYYMLSLV